MPKVVGFPVAVTILVMLVAFTTVTHAAPTPSTANEDEYSFCARALEGDPLHNPDLELGRGGRYLNNEEFARYMLARERRDKELLRRVQEEAETKRLQEVSRRTEELRARQQNKIKPSEIKISENSQLAASQLAYSDLPILSGNLRNNLELKLMYAPIAKREPINQGLDNQNESYYVTFEDGQKGVWKPHVETVGVNYRAEVLAYEIDKRFGFNLVPPTVVRTVDERIGSLQMFMESRYGKRISPSEMDKLTLFDFIIDNRDRTEPNYLVAPDGKVIAIDHGMSFTGQGANGTSFFKKRRAIENFLKTTDGVAFLKTLNRVLNDNRFRYDVESYLGAEDGDRLIKRLQFLKDHYGMSPCWYSWISRCFQ